MDIMQGTLVDATLGLYSNQDELCIGTEHAKTRVMDLVHDSHIPILDELPFKDMD